jgi:hypothetical protein
MEGASMTYDTKATNPKDDIGGKKLPLDLVPDSLVCYAAMSFLEGALKYGKFNWRIAGVRASIYIAAMRRHIAKFVAGEWADPVTRIPHLASVIACAGIILDAQLCDKLVDDRPPMHPTPELIDGMIKHIDHLKQLFDGHNPHQNTIEDSIWVPENNQTPITVNITAPPRPKSSEQLEIRPGATLYQKDE